ncbi:hypothetical protein SAMN05518861_14813 [Mesorhizobium sp. YR577]|nr:hypothetical protein SAMN05518861_14813 [Mesorhizobium sp. YR577]
MHIHHKTSKRRLATIDHAMAAVALFVLASFLGIIVVKVARIDLTIVIGIGVALVGYDLWRQLAPRR